MECTIDDGYFARLGKEKVGALFGYFSVYMQDLDVRIYRGVTGEMVLDIDGQRFTGNSLGDLDFRDGYATAHINTETAVGRALDVGIRTSPNLA